MHNYSKIPQALLARTNLLTINPNIMKYVDPLQVYEKLPTKREADYEVINEPAASIMKYNTNRIAEDGVCRIWICPN